MKKAQVSYMIIPIILIALLFGTFLFIFLKEMTDQYYIEPIQEAAATTANTVNLGTGFNETIQELNVAYDNTVWDYDFYAIVLFVLSLIGTSYTAIQANKQGIFSFFGYLFIISMLFLFVIFFIEQITDWFFAEIFYKVFNDTNLEIPFIEWVFSNIPMISIAWFMWLGLLNFLDFSRISDTLQDIGGFQR